MPLPRTLPRMKLPSPRLWASRKPFGIGEPHPNNFLEISRAMVENKDEAAFAYRIITQGVCDGCALGVSGLHDWTVSGPHLCNIRLRLLRLNTMPALDVGLFSDAAKLKAMTSRELRDLGRLPYPMLRLAGETAFARISWDDAMGRVAERVRATEPSRTAYYLTSRGMPNESYYAAQKAVRAMGSNNVDNAARICHSPSTVALKETIGAGATTCSFSDWIGTDLLVFVGSNPANNQPVATKYLHYAKKAGTRVALVNTMREPGMERYWIPSIPESALFGTRIADETFLVTTGGDVAFLTGALKHVLERGLIDERFAAEHTVGLDELRGHLSALTWEELERGSGATTAAMRRFGQQVGEAKTAVFVWSMGVTQHAFGEDGVRAIVNLALTRGFVGRDKCGLMPIRGHSGVQGGAEMGAYATAFPGGVPVTEENAVALSAHYGFDVPTEPGYTTADMLDAAHRGDLDVLVSVGGNFLESLPDPPYVEAALSRVPLRVHVDIVLSPQMFVDAADEVILLPTTTRYEMPGGVTETSTERRIMFSPEIAGRRIGEARPEWELLMELARRVRPEIADRLGWSGTPAIREEIARVVPMYAGIETLAKQGDNVQYGGPHLCAGWDFATPDGKARFSTVTLPGGAEIPGGMFAVATRRGKQFNTMVHERRDAITGADRDAVFIGPADAAALGLRDGDAVLLRSTTGELAGRVHLGDIAPRNLQVHWPEGNVLIDPHVRSRQSRIPDYNALVTVTPLPADGVAAVDPPPAGELTAAGVVRATAAD